MPRSSLTLSKMPSPASPPEPVPTPDEYKDLIGKLPKTPFDVRLTRIVPFLSFDSGMPRTFLFTSGRANRCNPKGVRCIYFAETDETAHAEWAEMDTDPDQPVLTFHGRLMATNIIDLANQATFDVFGLADEDLTGNFRFKILNIQHLGDAVSRQKDVVAIRYPSRPMTKLSKSGYNLAIFPDAISSPDSFTICGEKNKVLEGWP